MPSPTALLGLVSHAAAVERNWFQRYLGGKPREEITGTIITAPDEHLPRE